MIIRLLLAIIISIGLTACSKKKMEEDPDKITAAPILFHDAQGLMEQKRFRDAAKIYSKVYFQHPGSQAAARAELLEAYALYQASQYEEAVDIIENFVQLHPMHKDIAYAYHLKSMAYYMQIPRIEHDQSVTKKALRSMQEIVRRFPNSKQALDANMKIDLIRDYIAGKEMDIGRYYLFKLNPAAAINRFQHVVDRYETTSHIAEALHRLTESYVILGLKDEASKYASVLGKNYPASKWYRLSYNLVKK